MSASREPIPLSPQLLLEVLQAASSQSQELVQRASAQLKEWEKQPGYWTLLQDAFLDRSLPVELRWIAIITLKQGVDKYWRKSAQNSLSKPEKQQIRSRLLSSSIDEPHAQLAVQNAVIVGKVARLEYPLEWPKVFSEITGIIRQASDATASGNVDDTASLRLTRSLSILLHVVKELATGRLIRTKTNVQSVAPEILKVLGDVYVRHVQIWQGLLAQQPAPEKASQAMTISLLTLKIMRRLIIAGYEFPNRAAEVNTAWGIFQEQIWSFVNAERELSLSIETNALLRKHVVNIGKLFLDINTSHPAAFALLPNSMELLSKYWEFVVAHGETLQLQSRKVVESINGAGNTQTEDESEQSRTEFREKVALQGMMLFRGCIKMIFNPTVTFKYRHKEEKEEIKNATDIFRDRLFTPAVVTHCMEVLVTKYFILRPKDLEEWNEDPEGWNEQWQNAVDSWEFLIGPCAAKLFNDLVVNFKDVLAEPLMSVFRSLSSLSDNDILVKDAIYTAIGLAAGVIHPLLDFDEFLHNVLVNEIQIPQPGYNILRRRIAILIGQWISVRVSVESRPTVYKVMQHLLNRDDPINDLVVRLTAAHNLKRCVDEWDFRIDAFLPFVDDIFNKLMGLIDEAEQTETRMSLLADIGVVVDRLEHRVVQYADRIVRILPTLWEQTGNEHLFKQAILSVLSKVVSAMKDKSVQYHNMVLPLIKYSVEPGSGMYVYLLDDALELWESTVQNTPAPASSEMLELYPYLLNLLQLGSETLRSVLEIVESYVLLAPREIIENFRVPMFTSFAALLGTLKAENNGIVTHIVELLIRAATEMGGDQALSIVGTELVKSGFFIKVFETLRQSYEANQTTGPNRKYPPSALVVTDCFSVLARVILGSTTIFVDIVRQVSEATNQQFDVTIKWLLDEWFYHVRVPEEEKAYIKEQQTLISVWLQFGNVGHPKQRKLNCLALTKLLETNEKWILERMQDLMTVWTDVITELKNDEEGDSDNLIYWKHEDSNEVPEKAERVRRNEVTSSDPVHTVNAAEYIKHHLQQVQSNLGADRFRNDWLANVDPEVMKALPLVL